MMNIKQQLRRCNVFGFAACLRIPDAVWVVLLAARGFSLWEIGLAEGIFHIVGLVCEIPSGMAADLIGRRRSLAVAGLCGLLSALLMAFSQRFLHICLAMVFSSLSCSFISGSDEALIYDSLLQANKQDSYLSVSARYTQAQNLGTILSNAASLLAGILNYIGFYLLDAAVCFLRIVTALSLTEPTVTQQQAQRQESPFRDLSNRFREHVSEVYDFLRSNRRIGVIMLADGLVGLPSFLTLMFLQQRLHELGLATMWMGLPIMCISLCRMAGVSIGERLRPKRLRSFYALCAALVGMGTCIAGSAPLVPAVLGAMLSAAALDAWMLHLQKALNEQFPSDRRATLVSVNMMAYSVLMVIASPVVGILGDLSGSAGTGLQALGAVILAAAVLAAVSLQSSRKQP